MAEVLLARLARVIIAMGTAVAVLYLTDGKLVVIASMLAGTAIVFALVMVVIAPVLTMHRTTSHEDAKFWGSLAWVGVFIVACIIIVLVGMHHQEWFVHLWTAAGLEAAAVAVAGIAIAIAGPRTWH